MANATCVGRTKRVAGCEIGAIRSVWPEQPGNGESRYKRTVTRTKIEQARERIADSFRRSPCMRSETYSELIPIRFS